MNKSIGNSKMFKFYRNRNISRFILILSSVLLVIAFTIEKIYGHSILLSYVEFTIEAILVASIADGVAIHMFTMLIQKKREKLVSGVIVAFKEKFFPKKKLIEDLQVIRIVEEIKKISESGMIENNSEAIGKYISNILEKNKNREIIGSFTIASNVSGIITCYKKISNLLRKYKATVCFDAAASSSYMNISSSYYDALFLSPHKLLGGVGSCGILVVKKYLVDTSLPPSFAGGGTVKYVNKSYQIYEEQIEVREDAGTPAITQFIRAALAYKLRNEIGFEFIESRKKELYLYLLEELKNIQNLLIYGNKKSHNIGIVSFNIKDFNPYTLCEKLSNSGFQTRAGCSCAGPYGHDLLGLKKVSMKNRPGWLRVGVHYIQTKDEIKALVDEIKNSLKTTL